MTDYLGFIAFALSMLVGRYLEFGLVWTYIFGKTCGWRAIVKLFNIAYFLGLTLFGYTIYTLWPDPVILYGLSIGASYGVGKDTAMLMDKAVDARYYCRRMDSWGEEEDMR